MFADIYDFLHRTLYIFWYRVHVHFCYIHSHVEGAGDIGKTCIAGHDFTYWPVKKPFKEVKP